MKDDADQSMGGAQMHRRPWESRLCGAVGMLIPSQLGWLLEMASEGMK